MAGRQEFLLGLNPVTGWGDARDATLHAQLLIAYLSVELNMPVQVVLQPDYDAAIAAMRDGLLDAAIFGEYAFQRARIEAGAEALAVPVAAGSDTEATYQSVIIAGVETAIHTLMDLRGQTVGFVDRGSTTGYLIPRRMLREAGVDPDTDITAVFLNSHRAVLDAVARGEVPTGALFWQEVQRVSSEEPERASRLRTVAVSPPIPKGPFAVRRGLERETRQRLLQALLRIHEDAPEAARLIAAQNTRWRPASSRNVTLKTVAALSGVSYGTVSRVINGRAHVAPETYTRVMSIVQDLGFRPNAAAVSLIAGRSDLVGFIMPDTDDAFIARMIAGVQRALMGEGLHLVLCPTGGDRDEEAYYLGLLDDGRFGGLLLTEWSRETPLVSTLAATGRPLVLLGTETGSGSVVSVVPDMRARVAAAVAHLRALGHARIAVIVAPEWRVSAVQGLEDTGFTAASVHTATPETAPAVIRALLASNPPSTIPTALICEDERSALIALTVAHENGIAVPIMLSVIALADSWIAQTALPPLSTVASPDDAFAAHAIAALLAQMRAQEWTPATLPRIAPRLISRASTAPPRNDA